VLDRGSLARAMRATMSLPLVFPPVELDGRLLIDGGAMNNVPADVVRAMGADRVVAVNVGELKDVTQVNDTLLGVAGASIDAMMRASTRRAIAAADVVINVPLESYGSLDWRRSEELSDEGYRAAEALKEQLLPLALGEAEYARWQQERQDRRRRTLPTPAFVETEGFAAGDTRRMRALLEQHVGVPIAVEDLEKDMAAMSGLDRYDTITWWPVTNVAGESGLVISGRPKPYAPPFMMLGVNLENTTSSDYRITLTARYLAYGVGTSGGELRIDGTIGSDPALSAELYTPIGSTPLFVAPYAAATTSTFNVVSEDAVVARYGQTFLRAGSALGVNLGVKSDLRLSAFVGRVEANVEVGDPIFPSISGREAGADLTWRYDGQDSPIIPSAGSLATVRLSHVFHNPDVFLDDEMVDAGDLVTQLALRATRFWSPGLANRVFLSGGLGRTWGGDPFPHNVFVLGSPWRLGAYRSGELYGNNYYVATGGYLRQIARLPDFVGGPVFAGAWLENGDAFDKWGSGEMAFERRCRPGDGHAGRCCPDRGDGGLRWTLADVCRDRSGLPVIGPRWRGVPASVEGMRARP
jgi:NTE family protein